MARIKQSSIEEVRSRVNIYDLISGYVGLRKSGSKYKGLSPFTNEKTPSFFVDADKGFYYCFSTSQGGDIFKFIQIKENLNFPESVEFIATKFSIKLEYEEGAGGDAPSMRKQLFDIHEEAAQWYAQQFFADTDEAKEIRKYWIEDRGFSLEDAKNLRIGYAPLNSDGLKKIFKEKKFSAKAVFASKIFSESYKAKFCGRMMIPIADIQGRTIAFTARKTKFTPQVAWEEGKYINSNETDIFKKNLVVFNMDKAKNAAKEKNYCIVVEGQLDAIQMYANGFLNTVATQGTAAGTEHFALIKRFANKVVLLFDGDNAGRKAALRAIPICFKAELEPFVAVLPQNEDPDSMIKNFGKDAMRELVENKRRSALSFAAKEILADNPNPTPQDKRNAMETLFEIVDNCSSRVLRDDYLREISTNMIVDMNSVFADYDAWKSSQKSTNHSNELENKKNDKKDSSAMLTNAISDALLISLHYENVAEALSQVLNDEWIADTSIESGALRRILALYREGIGFNLSEVDTFFDSEDEKNLIYKLNSSETSSIENPVKYANTAIHQIYRNHITKEIDKLSRQMAKIEADQSADQSQKLNLLRKISRLRRDAINTPIQIKAEQ